MATLTRTQALDIFEENLPEIEAACKDNLEQKLAELRKPNIAKAKSMDHWWVMANVYQVSKEIISEKLKPTIRATEIRQQPQTEDSITQIDIERAKEHPISQLLNVTRKGNISCPFHEDKTPSFQIRKNNRFTCYSCGEHGDVIDLYQKLHKTDFLTAIKNLK